MTKRPIKFRAWRIDIETDEPRMFGWDELRRQYEGEMGDMFSDDSVIELMQYTGLKDKNGKEIYEGDIVRESPDDIVAYTRVVEYHGRSFVLSKLADFLQHEVYWTKQLEVIGNIYDNPELLK